MGRCDTAPVAEVGHRHVHHATPQLVQSVIEGGDFHPVMPGYQWLAAYQSKGGYQTPTRLREGVIGKRCKNPP